MCPEFFDGNGNLNREGVEQVEKGLQAKFACARLRQRYGESTSGQVSRLVASPPNGLGAL